MLSHTNLYTRLSVHSLYLDYTKPHALLSFQYTRLLYKFAMLFQFGSRLSTGKATSHVQSTQINVDLARRKTIEANWYYNKITTGYVHYSYTSFQITGNVL